jgi:hypothetical protein
VNLATWLSRPREVGVWAMRAVGFAGGREECAVGLASGREECAVGLTGGREECAVRIAWPRREEA